MLLARIINPMRKSTINPMRWRCRPLHRWMLLAQKIINTQLRQLHKRNWSSRCFRPAAKWIKRSTNWLKRWKIIAAKSVQVTFTLRKENCPAAKLGDNILPHKDCIKYLDRRLTWQNHIKAKREEILHRYKNLYWMLGRNSRFSLDNKLLIYKVVLKPVWMYGI